MGSKDTGVQRGVFRQARDVTLANVAGQALQSDGRQWCLQVACPSRLDMCDSRREDSKN